MDISEPVEASEPVEVRLPHDAMQTEKRLVNMKKAQQQAFSPGVNINIPSILGQIAHGKISLC